MPDRPLRILHATRSPVGGVIRHILDVAKSQADMGHEVGIVSDNLTNLERADVLFRDILPRMALGIHRMPIRRDPHPSDLLVALNVIRLVRNLNIDVLHAHGAKAGVFCRLMPRSATTIRIYTPHGGSLHYPPDTLKGKLYTRIERAMMNRTDLFLFESMFAQNTYERVVGKPNALVRCVFNGVSAQEFDLVSPAADATDVTFVGELRDIKGADLLIDAIAELHARGRAVTLTLGGDGVDMAALKAQVARLELTEAVRFLGHVKARHGFAQGRVLVVPSRGDSMPYVVIEAAAAGVPMLAANVGGIPEIFGPHAGGLFVPGDVRAIADAISVALDNLDAARERARTLRERIFAHFSQRAMVEGILAGYRDAFASH